jgi:hypothetical protein
MFVSYLRPVRLCSLVLIGVLACASLSCVLAAEAHGQADPCNFQVRLVSQAQRNLAAAENGLVRAQNMALSVESSVTLQIANLQAQVTQAEANVTAAGTTASANVGGCAISGFFFGIPRVAGCVGRGIAAGAAIKARAQAALRAAQGRLQSYTVFGANRLRREQQRIAAAEQQVALRQQELERSVVALATCREQQGQTVTGNPNGRPGNPGGLNQVIVNGTPVVTTGSGTVTITF